MVADEPGGKPGNPVLTNGGSFGPSVPTAHGLYLDKVNLERSAATISATSSDLGSVYPSLSLFPPSLDMGDPAVQRAWTAFHNAWTAEIHVAYTAQGEVVTAIAQSIRSLQHIDQQSGGAITQAGGGAGGFIGPSP